MSEPSPYSLSASSRSSASRCGHHAYRTLAEIVSRALTWLRGSSPLLELSGGSKEFEEMYRFGEKIGEGSFGKVFACREISFFPPPDLRCVKVVLLNTSPHCITKLKQEERRALFSLLLNLRHPGLVRFHTFAITDDTLYTVMERCCGPTLPDHPGLVSDGLLRPEVVQCLAGQILRAIGALHHIKLMHRDVKLDNFRFADEASTQLKLLDFGFCKATSGKPAQHTVTGTFLYAAPEVFDGAYCHMCDLWSIGVVLFHLLSGQLPFNTSDALILRSMHRDPVLMGNSLFRGACWKAVPPEGRALVRSLLEVDPAVRYSAAEAVTHPWLTNRKSLGQTCLSKCSFENLLSAANLKPLAKTVNSCNLAEAGGSLTDSETSLPALTKDTSLSPKLLCRHQDEWKSQGTELTGELASASTSLCTTKDSS